MAAIQQQYEIEDPFGKDSNGLPLTQLSNRIRANVHVEASRVLT